MPVKHTRYKYDESSRSANESEKKSYARSCSIHPGVFTAGPYSLFTAIFSPFLSPMWSRVPNIFAFFVYFRFHSVPFPFPIPVLVVVFRSRSSKNSNLVL